MPAVKTSIVKNAIMEYVAGKRAAISECKISSASGHVESYTLVIIPNPKLKPAKSEITDQYLVFATNMPKGKIFGDLYSLPEEYRARWGIETGYMHVWKSLGLERQAGILL